MKANHRTMSGEDFRAEIAANERRALATGDPLDAWPAYAAAVRDRLEAGRETYGDRSFGRSGPSTLAELEQEALDLAGWGFVLWARMRTMRHALEGLEVETGRRLASRENAQ
ncbi:MAG: hypothetical protein H5U40_05355 [Polyangiaceae bacterium]|nr:hypothetical protein [Polyangiaceae bacterium]